MFVGFSYEVTAVTGGEPDQGTSETLALVLYGEHGNSGSLLLQQEGTTLDHGTSSKFEVRT